MKNLWPERFEENVKRSARQILEEQAKLLPKLTDELVYATVTELSEVEAMVSSLSNEFSYRFDLRGRFLEHYAFNVCMFSHDITLYPVKFKLDEKVAAQISIGRTVSGYITVVDTPEDMEVLLSKILQTERIRSIVGSIIRLSR